MMYAIDMLKESERRYEGPVSTRFLVFTGIGAGLTALGLVAAYFLFVSLALRTSLERSQRTWQQLEPRYRELSALQQTLRDVERSAEEIEGWSRSGEQWSRKLLHLQRLMPPSIQLVRLEARDQIELPARPQPGQPMPDPIRRAHIYITGRITGAAGEDEITRLIDALLQPADPDAPRFRNAGLVAMQRDRREREAIVNLFDVDISGYPREIK